MDLKIENISGIGDFATENYVQKEQKLGTLFLAPNQKVFAVLRENLSNNRTLEIRTDDNLKNLLVEKYETIMQSRYFGIGGVEIVLSGQLNESDLEDLVRMSYNLTKDL